MSQAKGQRHLNNAKLKFRVLCRACNSFLHTSVYVHAGVVRITCECGNRADDMKEEFTE